MVGMGRTDIQEFEAAALPHLPDLFRTATRLSGDRGRAEDVVQEVYLQAWKSFHRFTPGTNCRAWLFKILMNTLHHQRRKWFNLRPMPETGKDIEETVIYAPPIPEKLTDEEVLSALDRVPAEFRAVVVLADVEEFSYKEIAHLLEIPIGTVMSRLSRGRKLLRELLAGMARSYGIGGASQEGQGA
jgi:RNA polymerase sigma-70 factor (ECF subfamily)